MTVEYRLDGNVLPRRLADILRPELASLATEIVDEIRAKIPAYARPLDGPYGKSIRAGVQHATSLFIEQIANPEVSVQKCYEVHHKLGQNEMREGRSLDDLQAAYRVGARVSWRRIMRVGKRNGLSSTVMSQLADAVFAYMDKLASVALDGYLEAKATSAGALETWRRRLLGMILQTPSGPAAAIGELAQLIGWTVPEKATPVAVQALPGTGHNQRKPTLDSDVLADLDGIEPRLLVPGEVTSARLERIRAALPQCRISVAPTVRLDAVTHALGWARKALTLAQQGVITDGLVIRSDRHLSTVLVHSDDRLLTTLRERLLAPLRDLTVKQRERMLETLRAWLDSQGSVPDMAARLGVHPQTVRYRMRQLDVTLGEMLHDPRQRFELELVLRASPAGRAQVMVPAQRQRQ
jgi:PucR C-terminal helix-turn-helix domain